ncbi:DUF983 domain-containing protein [Nioella nitratireducens]|uniref:DUF983 domain-containing protein n=1 Tax=Nioella nitratireducens TaxID=1287720 RepID=UPI0008FD4AC4|nr:DUF983 domain-containing protein [Nioella nitratireducens]
MATDMVNNIPEERPLGQALRRGWRRRCPCCGEGKVLQGYLKLKPECEVCGLDLGKARADDGPAYLTILVVGHVMVVAMLEVFIRFRPEPLEMAIGFTIGAVALSLYLLPRFKGAFVALQWAKRMHGL